MRAIGFNTVAPRSTLKNQTLSRGSSKHLPNQLQTRSIIIALETYIQNLHELRVSYAEISTMQVAPWPPLRGKPFQYKTSARMTLG